MDEIKKQRTICLECACIKDCKNDLKDNRIFYSGKKNGSCFVINSSKKKICNTLTEFDV